MALAQRRTTEAANAAVDAITSLVDGGLICIYDSEQPYNAETQLSGQTLLAVLQLANPAFAAAVDGVALANTITPETSALQSGTATWFRVYKADGVTGVWDGSVGTTDTNIVLDDAVITSGDPVSITEFSFSEALDEG